MCSRTVEPQKISHFVSENVPLELIVGHRHQRQHGGRSMPKLKAAVKEFLGAVPSGNEVTLLGFNDTVFTLTRRNTNPADRVKAVDRLAPWGATALYDVILRGVGMLGRETGRKALVVFTDGEDEGSHATIADVGAARCRRSDVTLYMIGQGRGRVEGLAEEVMERLSTPTGGRALFTDSIDELQGAFGELLDELSSQYLLGYRARGHAARRCLAADQGDGRWPLGCPGAAGVPGRVRSMRSSHDHDQPRRRRVRRERFLCVLGGSAVIVGLLRISTPSRSSRSSRPPLFRSGVEVTSVDVGVVDDRRPPDRRSGCGRLQGANRWSDAARGERRNGSRSSRTPKSAPADPLPEGFTSNENKAPGRLIVLAIDEPNIRFGGMTQIQRAATAFIDTLSPAGPGFRRGFRRRIAVHAGSCRSAAGQAGGVPLCRAAVFERPMMYTIGLGEAVSIYRGDQATLNRVVSRECADVPRRTQAYVECTTRVEDEADLLAQGSEQRGLLTIRGLGKLLTGLSSIDAPKTVVLLTEGSSSTMARPWSRRLGGMAAAARASLYVLQLDDARSM